MSSIRQPLLLGFAGAVVAAASIVWAGAAWPSPAPDVLSSLEVRAVTPAAVVAGADDRVHLVYELRIVNLSRFLVSIDSIEALDAADGRPVQTLSGERLSEKIVISGGESGTTFGPSHSSFVLMDVSLPKAAAVPVTLDHRFMTTLQSRAAAAEDHRGAPLPAGTASQITFNGARTAVDRRRAIAVSPPLRGPHWLAANGCCAAVNSHRAAVLSINGDLYVPERFAIDFVQLDGTGRLFRGPVANLSSYAYYGVPVYSVADGTVVTAHDGDKEEIPGALPQGKTIATAAGNDVIVDIGGGHFAVYAHLKMGSVRVKVGAHVKKGDILGLLGNTGNTSNPHLHFQISDRPSAIASIPLPYVFTDFTEEGNTTNFDGLFTRAAAIVDRARTGARQQELPLDNDVVGF